MSNLRPPQGASPQPIKPARSAKQAAIVVGLSLAGVVFVATAKEPGPGEEVLEVVWNTLSPSEQNDVCVTIGTLGVRAAAHEISQGNEFGASVDDVETFLRGLACHIQIDIGSG